MLWVGRTFRGHLAEEHKVFREGKRRLTKAEDKTCKNMNVYQKLN